MKKKVILAICIIMAIFLLFVAIGFVALGIMYYKNLSFTEGRYLLCDTGISMIISDKSEPIKMTNVNGKEDLFASLTNGDKILIINDGVEETYPASTGAYAVFKMGDGEFKDLPKETIDNLIEMNWIIDKTKTVVGEKIEVCDFDDKTISLIVPEGWVAEKTETSSYNGPEYTGEFIGIRFYPQGYKDNYIEVAYDNAFGVCGTGLTSTQVEIGGHNCTMGTYDGNEMWSFINYDLEHVAINHGAEKWWDEYGDEAMEILATVEYN